MLTKLKHFFEEPPVYDIQEIPGIGYGIVKIRTDDSRETLSGSYKTQDEAGLAIIKLSLQN